MPDISIISRCGDSPHNAPVIEFLVIIKVATTRVARSVEVGDPLDVLLDSSDDIAFHDLHVVDVVKEFDSGRVDSLANLNTPPSPVSLIILVVNFAV